MVTRYVLAVALEFEVEEGRRGVAPLPLDDRQDMLEAATRRYLENLFYPSPGRDYWLHDLKVQGLTT